MAYPDPNNRLPSSVPGAFYVDAELCIGCGTCCTEEAPGNFIDCADGAYVFKQPENSVETAQAKLAMEVCPMGAIGKREED